MARGAHTLGQVRSSKAIAGVKQTHQISVHERTRSVMPNHNDPNGACAALAREGILEALPHSPEALPGESTLQVLQLNAVAQGLTELSADLAS